MDAPRSPDPRSGDAVDWRHVGDQQLLAGMRGGEHAAFAEFITRYAEVLRQLTRRLRLSPGERTALVDDFLDEAAMRLPELTPPPRNLGAYLVTSFRRRLAVDWRTEARRDEIQGELLSSIGGGAERVVAESCSEYVVKLAAGELADAARGEDRSDALAQLREGLTRALRKSATDEEWNVIGWRGERMPYREIAAMLGITEASARVRVMRLRDRLREVAQRYIASLPVPEGIALARSLGEERLPAEMKGRAPPAPARHGDDRERRRKPSPPATEPGRTTP